MSLKQTEAAKRDTKDNWKHQWVAEKRLSKIALDIRVLTIMYRGKAKIYKNKIYMVLFGPQWFPKYRQSVEDKISQTENHKKQKAYVKY